MGSVSIRQKPTDFKIVIELQRTTLHGARVIIYVKSPDSDTHHRIMARILAGTDHDQLATDLERHLIEKQQQEPPRSTWKQRKNVTFVLDFIHQNPERILSP